MSWLNITIFIQVVDTEYAEKYACRSLYASLNSASRRQTWNGGQTQNPYHVIDVRSDKHVSHSFWRCLYLSTVQEQTMRFVFFMKRTNMERAQNMTCTMKQRLSAIIKLMHIFAVNMSCSILGKLIVNHMVFGTPQKLRVPFIRHC